MKILFVGPNPKASGGIETFGRNLKRIFNKDLIFLTLYKSKNSLWEVDDVYEIFEKNFFTRCVHKFFKKQVYNRYINKINPDIIIYNTPQDLKNSNFKGKKILVQHQTVERLLGEGYYFNKESQLIDYAKKNIDIWVTLSPANKEELIEKLDLDPSKVVMIRHTSEIPIRTLKKHINNNLIIISRLENNLKRIDLAIRAMKKLPEYILNIYGDGTDEDMLKGLVKELELINVIFHGRTNKILKKLDENAIFIMTSDSEGYGISNIEAMRRGLPIILRNTFTSAQDIIQGNGVLLEKKWKEEKFRKSVKETCECYDEFSKKSVELGKRYNFDVISKDWKKLIDKMEGK